MPQLVMVISGFTLLGQLTLFAINALGRGTTFKTKIVTADQTPPDVFLSVHIPAYRKPASVLIGTLTKLLGQYVPVRHEVIVIINNTPHRADWQPVAQWCAKSGAPFKLLRRDGVVGAKVSAINIALAESDQRTTHIVTVDADNQVTPNFLSDIGAEIAKGVSAFYQYPQAWRDVKPASMGTAREMEDYFKCHALAANLCQAMLLTGTLSVIPKSDLLGVGGWPMDPVGR